MRPIDNVFSAPEKLYRRIGADEVHGGTVLHHGIMNGLPRCSMNRQKYSAAPEQVLDLARRPELNGIAQVGVELFPFSQAREAVKDDPYEIVLEDTPEETNAAHCEIVVRRKVRGYTKNHVVNKKCAEEIAGRIAMAMSIVRAPSKLPTSG